MKHWVPGRRLGVGDDGRQEFGRRLLAPRKDGASTHGDALAARVSELDSELKGFGLWVRSTGARSYVLVCRLSGEGRRGAVKRVTIAAVGKVTPDQARQAAKKLLGSVAHGHDPAAERAERRNSVTVAELLDLFDQQYVATMVKPSTVVSHRIVMALLRSAHGWMKAESLTRAHVAINLVAPKYRYRYRLRRQVQDDLARFSAYFGGLTWLQIYGDRRSPVPAFEREIVMSWLAAGGRGSSLNWTVGHSGVSFHFGGAHDPPSPP